MGFQDAKKGSSEAASVRRPAGSGPLTAFIDQGSEFSGKLCFKDTVRIDGKLEGEITSDNTLIVGETGEIRASIVSEVVIVSGLVEGDVVANRQLTLQKTARLHGDVQTGSLLVEDGAVLNGTVKMGGSPRQTRPVLPEAGGPAKSSQTPGQASRTDPKAGQAVAGGTQGPLKN